MQQGVIIASSESRNKKLAKLLRGIAVKEVRPISEFLLCPPNAIGSTTYTCLCLLNVGNDSGLNDYSAICKALALLPGFVSLKVAKGKAYSFAVFISQIYAHSALRILDNAFFDSSAISPDTILSQACSATARIIHALPAISIPFPESDTFIEPADILRVIPGMHIIHNFITTDEELLLISGMNQHPWINLSERQVQHHGFCFDYDTNYIDFNKPAGPLPQWTDFLIKRMDDTLSVLTNLYPSDFSYRGFNQLTLNKYPPGSGISPHVDTHTRFDSPITSLSLLSPVQMEFRTLYHTTPPSQTHKTVQILLPARSIAFMSGQARFAWEHAIRGRRADVINGERVDRVLRVSLTFRGVRVDSAETVCNCEWNGLCDAKIVGGAVPDRLKNPNAVHAGMNRHGLLIRK